MSRSRWGLIIAAVAASTEVAPVGFAVSSPTPAGLLARAVSHWGRDSTGLGTALALSTSA